MKTVDTSDHLYDDFIRFIFLHTHRGVSALVNELPEELEEFRFLMVGCLPNLKSSVGLISLLAPSLVLFPPRSAQAAHVMFLFSLSLSIVTCVCLFAAE
jgi:hypothetical protein